MQELDHRVVGDLGEVVIPPADAEERRGRLQAHDVVGGASRAFERLRRRDRERQDDTARAETSRHAARRERSRSGRHAVVHDDRRLAAQAHGRPP